jgi:hypothetical protein
MTTVFRKTFKPLLLLLSFLTIALHSRAQEVVYPPYDPDAPELSDIQRTIDDAMDDVEDSLKKHGTFQPFAVVLLDNDSIAEIRVRREAGKTFSIRDLEEELSINALKGVYKVVSIFYLSPSANELPGKNNNVVTIHAEHSNDDFAYHFEYPFSRTAKTGVVFEAPTANFEEQVMFKP